ncbi:AzlD domain-containing protein [Conexibacter sp. SYSU D00693]|uniref:AzlD domain-containing protein n=1 Tax=Conexibacter sp. SYSU D00693 TaxID=2812560 RepID=UPI00196B8FBF|nr:AzlD domain-containing protein [Conexibacter sp. SYSU D00693]
MSSTTVWTVILGLAVVTFAIKAAGPVALGGRELPPRFLGVVSLMAPALLAALVVTSALADDERWHAGADTVGVACAGVVLWRGGSVILGVVVAAVVTAVLRAL